MISKNVSPIQRIPHSVFPLVLTAFDAMQASRDSAYKFLQEAHFFWCSHIQEPGWLFILDEKASYLVMPKRSDTQRLFEGGISADEARALSKVDRVLTASEGKALLKRLAENHDVVYTLEADPVAASQDFVLNPAPKRLHRQLTKLFAEVKDCRFELSALRACKQPQEMYYMQSAIDATLKAFQAVYGALQENRYTYEYELEAEMTHAIRSTGAEGHAYEPIVAGGKNALTLHYATNTASLPKNGLVLIDVGARVEGYAADITRTYAIGDPSPREVAVHAAVEKAHHAIIALIKPGVSLAEYQEKSDDIMKEALASLDLLNHPSDYRKYFPHAISHGLGIDVHESLGGHTVFTPGMVLTVEPGIYIPEEGIGVRIEDDILVTESGPKNLSAGLPTGL